MEGKNIKKKNSKEKRISGKTKNKKTHLLVSEAIVGESVHLRLDSLIKRYGDLIQFLGEVQQLSPATKNWKKKKNK